MRTLKKQQRVISILFFSMVMSFGFGQTPTNSKMKFPDNRMGTFAKTWFEAANTNNGELLKPYNFIKDVWGDQFQTITSIIKSKGGLVPEMISFQTEESISIYSKLNKGGWLAINLFLNKKNEIFGMGMRKSYKPESYALMTGIKISEVHDLISVIAKEIGNSYAAKEQRDILKEFLLEQIKTGKYDSITQGDLLAKSLTKDLVKFANDKHLQIIPPSMLSEVQSRFGLTDEQPENSTSEAKEMGVHGNPDGGLELEEPLPISGEILEGNIGHITLENFKDSPKAVVETERIMKELSNTKAIIIDLTQSGGGDGSATNNLLSYFFDKPSNNNDVTINPKRLSNVYASKQLYVLTSKRSISAAEAFAYYLQQRGRATLIGETTAGAGYLVNAFKMPYNFYLVNPITSKFDASKGEDWQGKGVTPDIRVSANEALQKAMSLIK